METKEVKIEYEGKPATVKLKSLTWGETNDCTRKAMKQVGSDRVFDFVLQQEYKLLKSIVEAPFEKSIDSLRSLPGTIGDKLFDAMNKLNKLNNETIKNSDSPLTQEE